MDPDEILKNMRMLLKAAESADTMQDEFNHLEALGSFFQDLDKWISNGGFLPKAWATKEPEYIKCMGCGAMFNVETEIEQYEAHDCDTYNEDQ